MRNPLLHSDNGANVIVLSYGCRKSRRSSAVCRTECGPRRIADDSITSKTRAASTRARRVRPQRCRRAQTPIGLWGKLMLVVEGSTFAIGCRVAQRGEWLRYSRLPVAERPCGRRYACAHRAGSPTATNAPAVLHPTPTFIACILQLAASSPAVSRSVRCAKLWLSAPCSRTEINRLPCDARLLSQVHSREQTL